MLGKHPIAELRPTSFLSPLEIHSTLSLTRVTHFALKFIILFINMGESRENESIEFRGQLLVLYLHSGSSGLHSKCFYLVSHLTDPHLALKIYFLDLFLLLYVLPTCMYAPFMCSVCECFVCVPVHCHVCLVETTRGCLIPWNWSIRQW